MIPVLFNYVSTNTKTHTVHRILERSSKRQWVAAGCWLYRDSIYDLRHNQTTLITCLLKQRPEKQLTLYHGVSCGSVISCCIIKLYPQVPCLTFYLILVSILPSFLLLTCALTVNHPLCVEVLVLPSLLFSLSSFPESAVLLCPPVPPFHFFFRCVVLAFSILILHVIPGLPFVYTLFLLYFLDNMFLVFDLQLSAFWY